jgi:hypothetical protein
MNTIRTQYFRRFATLVLASNLFAFFFFYLSQNQSANRALIVLGVLAWIILLMSLIALPIIIYYLDKNRDQTGLAYHLVPYVVFNFCNIMFGFLNGQVNGPFLCALFWGAGLGIHFLIVRKEFLITRRLQPTECRG